MTDSEKAGKRLTPWVKAGIVWAVALPLVCIGLAILKDSLPEDSAAHNILQSIIFIVSYPIFRIVGLLGIHGCELMGYILHIFAAIILYLSVSGFCIGAGLSQLEQMIRKARQENAGQT